MHVLITGGAGFIGSHIVEYHLEKGNKVYAVDNLSTGLRANIEPFLANPNFQFIEANILSWPDLNNAALWADRIYHMAAVVGVYRVLENPTEVLATNIAGCERLLRAVALNPWRPRVIIPSSSEVYGPGNKQPLHEDDILLIKSAAHSRWSYTISKISDEAFALAYAKNKKVEVTLARIFNTIGPRQTGRYGMVVPNFVKQATDEKPIVIFGDGEQTRSFCDVRDLVVMLDSLANNSKSICEIINVGTDNEISINYLAQLVKNLSKSNSDIKHISYEEAYGEYFEETPRRKPDLNKLKQFIDLKNKWTLEETILDLIKKLKNE